MKLFLIDGHALIFKTYYAFLGRNIVNSKGMDTSILFGFIKSLLELIDKEQPTHLAISFDLPGGTFRNELYPEYKANRAETPQLVVEALDPLTEIVKAMNISVLTAQGFEADDVIGTVAQRFASDKIQVYMVTPDKDYGQLVSDNIFQYKPGKSGGESEVLGIEEICAKWKIASPLQVIDMLTLCGDSSDNVPGVQGVGPVGAAKLLDRYGSIEGIYSHISELSTRQKENFEEAKDNIALFRELVTIKTDVPLDLDLEDMRFNVRITAELEAFMDKYEFPSLKRLLHKISNTLSTNSPAEDLNPDSAMIQQIQESRLVEISQIKGGRIALTYANELVYVAENDGMGSRYAKGSAEEFKSLIEDEAVVKVGFGLKAAMNAFAAKGISLKGRLEDVELMHYILDPEGSHDLSTLAMKYLGIEISESAGAENISLFDDIPDAEDEKLGAKDLGIILALADSLNREIDKTEKMRSLYDEIEAPLISVLSRMECLGVKIDLDSMQDFASTLKREISEIETEVREIASEPELNLASPKQVGVLIYEKMKLKPGARKTRSGSWPTDESKLQELSDRSPVIGLILEYRGLRKLLSTYIEPFASYVSPLDGRVHTTFNQTLVSTGRLSSSNPNLQNIPIRTERGREIRRAFVPGGEDMLIMSADYSQIELRIMAHLSGDEHLIKAFQEGHDIHAATAAKIFSCDIADISPEQRRVAKTVNFGIMYGMSSFGLSQRLQCSLQEAKKIIEDYFALFPAMKDFVNSMLSKAMDCGYVETIFGRRRYISGLNPGNSNNRMVSEAQRNAVNAPIQGSAADIIKLAMIHVDKALSEKGLQARMLLQIHDELLLEVPTSEIEQVRSLVVNEMENVLKLSVPLTVECNYGKNWLEAH